MKTILGKNNHLTIIILFFLSTLLTSCFDVIQNVKINTDRSGEFLLKVNLSKSKDQVDRLLGQDSIQGIRVPSKTDISSKLNQLKTRLSSLNGLSNVKLSKDFEDYIFEVSFDFKDIDNLNEAQGEIQKLDPSIGMPVRFSLNDKFFSLAYSEQLLGKANNSLVKFKFDELKTADFVTICRFDKEVKGCTGTNCKTSSNKKATFNKISVADFIENKKNQALTVYFK